MDFSNLCRGLIPMKCSYEIFILIINFPYINIYLFCHLADDPKRLTNEDIIEAIKTNKRATTLQSWESVARVT